MLMKVYLKTAGMFDNHDQNETDYELWESIAEYMDGEAACVVDHYKEDGTFTFLFLGNAEKNKELAYMKEQDSMMGCYINDRDRFNKDWDNEEYESDGLFILKEENLILPWHDPRKLIKQGVEVPFCHIIDWHCTYGCNNWRKRRKLPMFRGKCGYTKRRVK
jgi:hypothetical protein